MELIARKRDKVPRGNERKPAGWVAARDKDSL